MPADGRPVLTTPTARGSGVFERLDAEVIRAGLCTQCGTCAGLSGGAIEMAETPSGLTPVLDPAWDRDVPAEVFDACPGKGLNYPDLCGSALGRQPGSWLIGCCRRVYVGYSLAPSVRRGGASGGVITQTLLHLLENGLIDGAVVVRQGSPKPWRAEPIIATSAQELVESSQSVYLPVAVNAILPEMERFPGRLAYVGLPDQVAALRRLQQIGHPGAVKVDYVLGPYVGIGLQFGAIASYLRSNGVGSLDEVEELRYREGEWPGYLQVKTRSGRVLRAEKFYYNYLLPFYATPGTLMSVDFTNELTDVSVGDAWHPRYESERGGFSVVVARSERGEEILASMVELGLLSLEEISVGEALTMHGHMIDFKKRGAFIRMGWRRAVGRRVPDYGYRPTRIPLTRKLVEAVIVGIFAICGTRVSRRLVEVVPIGVVGPVFSRLRKWWKRLSKPAKRSGLRDYEVETWRPGSLPEDA
jgi:coenzyme F420 hydrogenase subunit beta